MKRIDEKNLSRTLYSHLRNRGDTSVWIVIIDDTGPRSSSLEDGLAEAGFDDIHIVPPRGDFGAPNYFQTHLPEASNGFGIVQRSCARKGDCALDNRRDVLFCEHGARDWRMFRSGSQDRITPVRLARRSPGHALMAAVPKRE